MTRFRIAISFNYLLKLLPYLKVTLFMTAVTLLIGLTFGLLFAMAKLSRFRILRGAAALYTSVMRSLPAIVLIFLVYYGLPALGKSLFGIRISKDNALVFAILTFGMFSIAVLSEAMKSAYRAVDRGQYEAAVSNGLTRWQSMTRIVVPQAFQILIPNLGNTVIMLLKEGSLAYTIGVIDIMGYANQTNGITHGNDILEIFLPLAAIYWLLSILLDRAFRYLERRLSYHRNEKVTI